MIVASAYGKTQAVGGGCPHGAAPGACGVCNGGGGGGGGARKNTSGLMSWNEAWSVWNAIQVNKARQSDYLKGSTHLLEQENAQTLAGNLRQMAAVMLARLNQALLMPIMQAAGRLALALGNAMATAGQAVSRLMGQLTASVQNVLNGELLKSVTAQVLAVIDKLTAVLGDLKQRAQEWLEHNMEQIKTLLYKHLVKRLQTAVNFAGLKEFTGKVIQKVGGWLFDKFRGKKPERSRAFNLPPS